MTIFASPKARAVIVLLVILGAVGWLLHYGCLRVGSITPADIRNYILSFGPWAAWVFIAAYAINTVTILPPIAPLALAAGLVFGEVWGAIYLFIAAVIGTTLTFLIARCFGRKIAERILSSKFKDFDVKLEAHGFYTVFFLRLVPLAPYEVINYASGLSKIRFRDYFWATFWGLIPGIIVNALLGGGIGDIRHWSDLMSPKFFLAFLVGVISVGVPVAYQWLKYKKWTPYN